MANRPLFSDQHLSLSLSLFRSQRGRSREKNRKDDNSFLLTAEGGRQQKVERRPSMLARSPTAHLKIVQEKLGRGTSATLGFTGPYYTNFLGY